MDIRDIDIIRKRLLKENILLSVGSEEHEGYSCSLVINTEDEIAESKGHPTLEEALAEALSDFFKRHVDIPNLKPIE